MKARTFAGLALLAVALGGLAVILVAAWKADGPPSRVRRADLLEVAHFGDRELSRWTAGGLQADFELEVRIDGEFAHSGPAWMDGAKYTEPATVSLEPAAADGVGGGPRLVFEGGEWWEGYRVTLAPAPASGSWTVAVRHHADIALPERYGDATRVGGRVLLDTGEWGSGREVHVELALVCEAPDGRVYFLRGAGAAAP